jgi:hypothetical protein
MLPAEHLHSAIQIIRESTHLNSDEDKIDLEIDQLAQAKPAKTTQKSEISAILEKPFFRDAAMIVSGAIAADWESDYEKALVFYWHAIELLSVVLRFDKITQSECNVIAERVERYAKRADDLQAFLDNQH